MLLLIKIYINFHICSSNGYRYLIFLNLSLIDSVTCSLKLVELKTK